MEFIIPIENLKGTFPNSIQPHLHNWKVQLVSINVVSGNLPKNKILSLKTDLILQTFDQECCFGRLKTFRTKPNGDVSDFLIHWQTITEARKDFNLYLYQIDYNSSSKDIVEIPITGNNVPKLFIELLIKEL